MSPMVPAAVQPSRQGAALPFPDMARDPGFKPEHLPSFFLMKLSSPLFILQAFASPEIDPSR